jgi:hypothetical protein
VHRATTAGVCRRALARGYEVDLHRFKLMDLVVNPTNFLLLFRGNLILILMLREKILPAGC